MITPKIDPFWLILGFPFALLASISSWARTKIALWVAGPRDCQLWISLFMAASLCDRIGQALSPTHSQSANRQFLFFIKSLPDSWLQISQHGFDPRGLNTEMFAFQCRHQCRVCAEHGRKPGEMQSIAWKRSDSYNWQKRLIGKHLRRICLKDSPAWHRGGRWFKSNIAHSLKPYVTMT